MTDQEHKKELVEAVAALNMAIRSAVQDGLEVDVQSAPSRTIDLPHDAQQFYVEVSRVQRV